MNNENNKDEVLIQIKFIYFDLHQIKFLNF